MPSDKSLFLQKIDALSIAETGKTAEQSRLGLVSGINEINQISEYNRQSLQQPTKQNDYVSSISDILEKNYLIDNQQGLLSNPDNKKIATRTESLSGPIGGSGLLMGTQDRNFETINLDKISLDPKTKSSFGTVAGVLSRKLEEGDLNALTELKTYFQKAYSSGLLSDEAREKLQKEYTDLTRYYNDKKVYGFAEQNFNKFLESTDKNQKQTFLNQINQANATSNAYNFAYNIGIDPNDTESKQKLLTDMLDVQSYVPGSFVYNTENLNAVKNSSLELSPIFGSSTFAKFMSVNPITQSIGSKIGIQSQKEYVTELANINYNYTNLMGVAAKNKEQELSQSLIEVNQQLEKDPNNQNVLNQKKQLEENLLFTKDLSKKLEPLQDKKEFYKLSYPELYREEVKKEKSEILYNDLATSSWYQHPLRKAKSIAYRGGEQMLSNATNQVAGIAALTGDKVGAFGFNLGAKSFAPPQYRRVNDLNKNSLIESNEVIKDSQDNPIYVSNVHWVDEKGEGHWNLSAATEQTLPIAIDVAQTILLSRGVGAAGRGMNLSWSNIGKSAKLSTSAQKTFLKEVAPRISTFGNTFATTFPRFYAEERNNFKNDGDARNVALMRSGVEAISETLIPDTDFFKADRSLGPLDGLLKKAGKLDPTNFSRMTYNRDVLLGLLPKNAISPTKAALLVAPSAIRKTLSGAVQESLEEEFSLLGNYFVDKYAASQDFTVEETNDLTLQNGLETFVSGFIPSLFISGVPAAFDSRSRRSQARWDIANNPEQYLSFINKQVQDGKLTKEQAVERTAAVNGLKTRLDSIADIKSLKNISTLLDDRDAQFNYFNSVEDIEDLLSIDTSTFTPEQIAAYEKQLSDASDVVLDSKRRIEKYVGLTEQEKKGIISNMFAKQAKTATNPENSLTTLVNTLNQTAINRVQVSPEDERQDFISAEYDKFITEVEATIADRLDGFQQLLEESPEKLTLLELELAKTNFIPFLQQYKGSKRQEAINAPFVPTSGPQLQNFYEQDLIDLINSEIETRKKLDKNQSIAEGSFNLNNPETKDAQVAIMTAAELSQAELESGQLEADAHTHLTDAQRLMLGNMLERHAASKETDPNKKTQLESYRDYANNFYELSTKGLTPEESLTVIKDINKSILDKANIKPITDKEIKEELSKTEESKKEEKKEESKKEPEEKKSEPTEEEKPFERGFTPTSSKEPKEEKTVVVSERPLNEDVYNQFRNERVRTQESLEDQLVPLESEEDRKVETSKFNSGVRIDFFDYLINNPEITSLAEAEAAMLGFFPGEEKAITKFFDALYSNEPDFSLEGTSFLPVVMLDDFQTRMMGLKNNLTPKEQEKVDKQEEEGDTIPDSKPTETEIEENNVNNKNELNQQEDNKTQAVNKNTLQLNIIELDKQDRLTENPFNLRALNIVQVIDNKVRGGVNADVAILIQLPLSTLKTVLSKERFGRVESFINEKKPLNAEQKKELESIFTFNGIRIVDQVFIDFFAKNPAAINNQGAALTVITNKEGEVIYFTPEGYIGTPETGAPLITPLKSGPAKDQVTAITNNNTPVLATITGTEGTSITKPVPLSGLVNDKSKVYVHIADTIERESPFGNKYTLEKGAVYLEREGAIYPYSRIDLPQVEGDNLFNLIEAFNNGTLPKEFPTDAQEFLELIADNFFSERKNKTLRYFPQGQFFIGKNKDNNKLNIKATTSEGKAKVIGKSTQKELVSKSQIRKPLFANRLNSEQPFKAIVFVNGQPTIKEFKTYKEFVLSSDFGATVKKDWQKTLKAEQPLPMVPTQPETSKSVQDVEENIVDPLAKEEATPTTTDARVDIERRRQKDLKSIPHVRLPINAISAVRNKKKDIVTGKDWEDANQEEVDKLQKEYDEYVQTGVYTTKGMVFKHLNEAKEALSKVKEINANYDAELATLEQSKEVAIEKKPVSKRRSLIERANAQIKGRGEDTGIDPNSLKRARTLSNKITKQQNEAAKAWVESHPIFKNTPFIFDTTIAHPEAYAIWSKAGIQLFEGANYAEAYHEAWHEFSQLYLNGDQKEKLYSEARKIWGDLPFVELEEKIAESFRQYALTGGQTIPSEIAKYNETKSIFQKIWDFITNLISEKKTIDKYFDQLYKGNITRYKRNEQNAYFKKLYSSKLVILDENDQPLALSYTETQKTIEEFDGLFVDIANAILKPYNASVVNVLLNPKQVKTVYQNVVKYLDTVYQEEYEILEQNPDDFNQAEKVDHLALKIVNIATILDFHKNNSTLFDNKIKSTNILNAIDEVLNEPENEGIGEFEKSIEEMSQKDMASEVIINAIRTLPRYEGTEKVTDPVLGFALLGDFETNWTILQRELTGLNTYNEMYNKIKDIAVNFPQFNTFLDYLPNPDNTITRITDLAFKVQFFNLFTMPYIDGSTVKIERDDQGNITETKVLKALSLDAVQLRSQLDADFYTEAGPFKVLTTNGSYALNTEEFFSMFGKTPSIPAGDPDSLRGFYDQVYLQLQALGLNYTSLGLESLRTEKPETVIQNLNLIRTKLKSLSNVGTPILTPLGLISKEHKTEKDKIKSEVSAVNYFLNLEIDANPTYANDMRYNAVGKQIWSVNQHTYMTKVLSVLNDSTNYKTLEDVEKEIPHLNQAMNTNARGSWVLKYLFNVAGNRILENGKPRKVEIVNLLGIEDGFDGEKTIDSLSSMKHYADIVGLLNGGVEELNRLSGKSTTRGIGLDLSARKFLGLAKSDDVEYTFTKENEVRIDFRLFSQFILPILKSEIDTQNSDVNKNVFRFKSKNVELAYFEKILSPELRQSLVNDLKELPSNTTLEDAFLKLSYAQEVYSKFNEYLNNNVEVSQDTLAGYNLSDEQLAKYHFYSFVMRVEQHKLFFNHPYYYKNAKDIEKRLSAWNAYGSYTNMDRTTVAALNNVENDPYAQEKAFQQYAIENNLPINVLPKDPTKLSYLVFNDNAVVSETAQSPAYDKVRDAYTKDKDSKAQDAASVATMDFFRRFYATSTGITLDMEEEFTRQNNIWSTYLQLKNANQYEAVMLQRQLDNLLNQKPKFKFSVKKLQYAGNNQSIFGPSIPIFHKYSVKPLLPSEAVTNPRAADILFKLYASGADYGVFSSGTKIAETISPIDLFKDGQVDTSPSSPGIIEIKYLKEQVIVENKESFQNIFSSQLRKLIYKDATTDAELEAYKLYASYVKNLVEYDSNEFLEKLENKEKLVEFIVGELSRKGAAQATKDLIQIKEDGKLQYLLDALVDRTVMEGAIVSSVKNKVIRQKVNGAQRVQFPVSLMSDRKLKYYDLKDGKVTKAETIISFSKLYYPLLTLEYNGSPIGELNSKGEPINPHTGLKRLNEALNDPSFRKQYERQLNIVAIRIPGQGYNSIESFEIVQFLPEETGDIILVPDEMVVKSGSDYDIDKLFCYDPFIEADGSVMTNNLTPKEAFARKKQLALDIQTNKEIVKEYLEEKQNTLNEIEEFLKSKNISSVSEVYKQLKQLKAEKFENDVEVDEEMDAKQMLLDKFKNGLSRKEILEKNLSKDQKTKLAERKAKLKNLSSILQDYSETKLSLRLQEANEALAEIYQELTDSKNELKAIRNRFANSILFNMSDRLTNEEIFEDLITPNSISEIEKAAKDLTKNPTNEANYTNIVNPNYQLYVFSLNTYKKALGTDAKNNVLHSILQKVKLTIVDKQANSRYILPANRVEGNLTFEGTKDTKGKPISLVQGQMISAHVDIEKDDRIALINFNNVVTPIVNYATMLGTPFEAMVNLVNMSSEKGKDSLIAQYSKLNDFDSIMNIVQQIQDPTIQNIVKNSRSKFGYSEKKFINLTIGSLVEKYDTETILKGLFKENVISDVYRLGLFLEMKNQADKVRRLSANTDFDTLSPQNFESLRANGGELSKLKEEKFFEEEAFNKVIFESVVSPFQVQTSILDKFVEIFPVSASKTVTDGIVKLHQQYAKKNKFLQYETLSRVFKNDFLYSMYINEVPNIIQYESLLDKRNSKNLKAQYEYLKKKLAEKKITSQNRIFDLVRFNTDEKSNFLRTGLKQNSFDYSVDFYREQFNQGFNYSHPQLDPIADAQLIENMQTFFKNFAYAGILGSQLNKKFDSYLPLIPEQIYTYPMSTVLENFANLSEEEQRAKLSEFTKRFRENHPEFAKVKDVNPDLNFYKDYVLSRPNITPSKSNGETISKVDEEVDTTTTETQSTAPISNVSEQLDLSAEYNQAAQDSLMAIRNKNKKNKDNCQKFTS